MLEHQFYGAGKTAFSDKKFMDDDRAIETAKSLFAKEWKKVRYHNLVRLGGDILRSNLAEHSKSTILGALLRHAEQRKQKEVV